MKKILLVIVSVFVVASITGCGDTWDDVGDYDYYTDYTDYDFDSDYDYDYDVDSDNNSADDNDSDSYGGKSDYGEGLAQTFEAQGYTVLCEGYIHDKCMEVAEKIMLGKFGETVSVEDSIVLESPSTDNIYLVTGVTNGFETFVVTAGHDSEEDTWFAISEEFYG